MQNKPDSLATYLAEQDAEALLRLRIVSLMHDAGCRGDDMTVNLCDSALYALDRIALAKCRAILHRDAALIAETH